MSNNIDKLDIIIKTLNEIKEEQKEIKEVLTRLEKDCARMDGHINFVEETYDTLKFPITIFKNKIEQVFGSGGKQKEIKE
jgi:peptidoglycan hydrolase CwlO-like protein